MKTINNTCCKRDLSITKDTSHRAPSLFSNPHLQGSASGQVHHCFDLKPQRQLLPIGCHTFQQHHFDCEWVLFISTHVFITDISFKGCSGITSMSIYWSILLFIALFGYRHMGGKRARAKPILLFIVNCTFLNANDESLNKQRNLSGFKGGVKRKTQRQIYDPLIWTHR